MGRVIGVVMLPLAIVRVIHLLGLLLCLVFRPGTLNKSIRHIPLTIEKVFTLGLGALVDLGPGKAHQQLLGKGVVDNFALLALVVLKGLETRKCRCTADQLVGKVGLVRFAAVHLLVGIRSFVWVRQQLNKRGRK